LAGEPLNLLEAQVAPQLLRRSQQVQPTEPSQPPFSSTGQAVSGARRRRIAAACGSLWILSPTSNMDAS
jgi:hypothetical protein